MFFCSLIRTFATNFINGKFLSNDMADTKRRESGYAVGVQMFDWIREREAVYVDKTEYVWRMVTTDAINFFLSRPRRFGKSLLVDTLRCYFEGRKELFEGLYI